MHKEIWATQLIIQKFSAIAEKSQATLLIFGWTKGRGSSGMSILVINYYMLINLVWKSKTGCCLFV